jgi:hypothetical protein
MRPEPGVFSSYPFNRHLDRIGHAQSCALRGGTGTAVASSTSDGSAKLATNRIDFVGTPRSTWMANSWACDPASPKFQDRLSALTR